jgi:hypothetical protein
MGHTIDKMIFAVAAAVMMILTLIGAVNAQAYSYTPQMYADAYAYPSAKYADTSAGNSPYINYVYYEGDSKMPMRVSGPYPQYYLVNKNADWNFAHDDLHHYDDFVGYNDLDVMHPDGSIDVIRSDYSTDLDLSQVNTSMKMFGEHVQGVLPDGSVYIKHYMHDHAWDDSYDDYYGNDYGYNSYGYDGYDNNYGYYGGNYGNYNYYSPYYASSIAYRNAAIATHPCQQQSICQKTNSCC